MSNPLTAAQQAQYDADIEIQAALKLGFKPAGFSLTNIALGEAIRAWVNTVRPDWAPDDGRWTAWTAKINKDSATITDAAQHYRDIVAGA